MADINVKAVLAKLNTSEKIDLLSGMFPVFLIVPQASSSSTNMQRNRLLAYQGLP